MDVVHIIIRQKNEDGRRIESGEKETDKSIVWLFFLGKYFPEMQHHIIEGIVEKRFELLLALVIRFDLMDGVFQ
jgi:hypothetical protein